MIGFTLIETLATHVKFDSNIGKIRTFVIKTRAIDAKTHANVDKTIGNPIKRFKIHDKAVPITPPIPSLLSTLAKRTNQPCNPNFAKELISPSCPNALCKCSFSIEKIDYI